MCKQITPGTAGGHHTPLIGGTGGKDWHSQYFFEGDIAHARWRSQRERREVLTAHRIRTRSGGNIFLVRAFSWLKVTALCHHISCALWKSSSSVSALFTALLTLPQQPAQPQEAQPLLPRQPPAQDRQSQHLALCTLQSVGLSGRLTIQSTLPSFKSNMTFDLPTPGQTPATTTSRRTSFCSQATSVHNAPTVSQSASQKLKGTQQRLASPLPKQERDASDARGRVYHSGTEDTGTHHTP